MPVVAEPRSTFSYVLDCDRRLSGPRQAVFLLRGLSANELDSVEAFMRPNGVAPAAWITDLAILRIALVGWRRLRDSRGDEVAFCARTETVSSGEDVSAEFVDSLIPLPPGTASPQRWVGVGLPREPADLLDSAKGPGLREGRPLDGDTPVGSSPPERGGRRSRRRTGRSIEPGIECAGESWSPLVAALQRRLARETDNTRSGDGAYVVGDDRWKG